MATGAPELCVYCCVISAITTVAPIVIWRTEPNTEYTNGPANAVYSPYCAPTATNKKKTNKSTNTHTNTRDRKKRIHCFSQDWIKNFSQLHGNVRI